MDHESSSLVRPHDLFASQFLLAVAWTLFVGPILLIGVTQALKRGVDHLVTFIVVFGICQNLGGLLGSSVLGTLQARHAQEYVTAVSSHVDPTRAGVPQRLAQQQRLYLPVMTDPVRNAAEGTAQLAQIVRQEAAVRAYNDVFSVVSVMSLMFLCWSLYLALGAKRRARRGAVAATPASAV